MSTPPNPLFAEFQALADEPSSAESSPILLPTVGSKLRKRKSRVGSTDEEDDDDNEEDELNEEEPLPPPAVTTPSSESVNSSNSPEQTVSASSANSTQSANQNLIVYAKKLATKHRLRPDKAGMLTEFSSDAQIVRDMKLYALMLSLQQAQDEQVKEAAPWEVSKQLKTNIRKYTKGVLLSARLASYKGEVAKNCIATILKTSGLESMPKDAEKDFAKWGKIWHEIEEAITAVLRSFKISIQDSVEKNWSIYKLTTKLCAKTKCRPSVELCTRVAVLRKVFAPADNQGPNYWDLVDRNLADLRATAESDPLGNTISKILRRTLKRDRADYGNDQLQDIPTTVTPWQQEIDDAMDK